MTMMKSLEWNPSTWQLAGVLWGCPVSHVVVVESPLLLTCWNLWSWVCVHVCLYILLYLNVEGNAHLHMIQSCFPLHSSFSLPSSRLQHGIKASSRLGLCIQQLKFDKFSLVLRSIHVCFLQTSHNAASSQAKLQSSHQSSHQSSQQVVEPPAQRQLTPEPRRTRRAVRECHQVVISRAACAICHHVARLTIWPSGASHMAIEGATERQLPCICQSHHNWSSDQRPWTAGDFSDTCIIWSSISSSA